MGKASRTKGARGEREVAAIFKAAGFDCHRTPNSGGLMFPGDLIGLEGVHVEVKRAERLCIPQWLKQARDEAPAGTLPALCFRQSHSEWHVVVPLKAFVRMAAHADPKQA